MSDEPRELVFLVNGKSRSGAKSAAEAEAALKAEGFAVKRSLVATSPAGFVRTLDGYIADKEPLIAIGGGDGTQRMAAERIAGTSSVMAVFPMGTGNAWASDLGIPVGAGQAAKALATGAVESIDLGMANDRGFVNVATIGLTSLIVRNIPKSSKGSFGRWVYLPAVVRSLSELRPFGLHVEAEGAEYSDMALLFVAAAGRTHAGPFRVTRTSSNSDGLLSLYVLDDTDRRGLIAFGLALLTGLHTFLDEVWSCETASAKVAASPEKRIIVDGEPMGTTPLSLSVKANALKVLVPTDSRRTGGSVV